MRRVLPVLVLVVVAIGVRAAPPPALDAEGQSALSTFLSTAIARGDVPGVVVMVVDAEGVLYHEAFGKMNVASGVDMRKDAIFRIASMTKPVTSLATMMLVEEGKLALADEASKYIPSLESPQVFTAFDPKAGTYETRAARRAITIRHLLTNTSGIGYSWSDPALAIAQKATGATNDANLPLVHDPGERWTYGASTRVLGDIVEKVSGLRIDAFIEARIARPLGMRETGFTVAPANYARVVTQHQKRDGQIIETPNPDTISAPVRGDGGLFSTAADYSRFVRLFLNRGRLEGTRLLREETVREMSRSHTGNVRVRLQPSNDLLRAKPYPLGAGEDVWGLGFQLAAPAAPDPVMRAPGSMSWAGIYNTFFWIDPARAVGVIVLMQMLPFYDEAALGILQGVERRVYAHLE
jgi:CubicO group peptidase (beta-lactamase class C family)